MKVYQSYVYLLTNIKTKEKYVGVTSDLRRRLNQYKSESFNENRKAFNIPINKSIRDYGIENFTFDIIHVITSKNIESHNIDRQKWEAYFIGLHNTFENGLNQSIGGIGPSGCIPTKETIAKRSQSLKGRLTGLSNPNYGKFGGESMSSKPVIQMDINGMVIAEWASIIEAASSLGIAHQNISKCCKGKRITCGGFKWRYKDEK